MKPGDELRIAAGTYQGSIEILVSGTQKNPIVIRSEAPNLAIFSGATSIVVTGSDIVIADFRFLQTGTAPVRLEGVRTKLLNNTFEQCGDGSSGAGTGVIVTRNLTPGWPTAGALGSLTSPPLVQRNNLISGNTFLQPRNTVYWQDHGLVGNEFSFNTVVGPHAIQANFETEAIKIGYSFGTDETKTRVIFNTIQNWVGIPYVIGIKSNKTLVGYNLLSGRVQLRYGNRNAVVGNVITDGDLHVGGSDHLIKFNVIRTINPQDNYGPFAPFFTSDIRNQYGVFDGAEGRPHYIDRLANSRVEDNEFISLTPNDGAVIQATGFADVLPDQPPINNTFNRNVLIRSSNWNNFLAVSLSTPVPVPTLVGQNRWDANVLHCIQQCSDSDIKSPLPTPSNRVGAPPNALQPEAKEFFVPFNDSLISDDFLFLTTALPPAAGFAATAR